MSSPFLPFVLFKLKKEEIFIFFIQIDLNIMVSFDVGVRTQ
jgi:hypothetical protein